MRPSAPIRWLVLAAVALSARAQDPAPLPGTMPLNITGELSTQMVAGIDRWLTRETARVAAQRPPPAQSPAEINARRARLRAMIGAHHERMAAPRFEFFGGDAGPVVGGVTNGSGFIALRVRWPVFEGVHGEGLLLRPIGPNGRAKRPVSAAVAIPDADHTPEMLAGLEPGVPAEAQFARTLAASGWEVLVPVLVNRGDDLSGNPRLKRFTNQPHREWIYRQAYELGAHVIGYEVQKIEAGIEALSANTTGVALAGYGEGGLLALHTAALNTNARAALVSGHLGPREQLWREPIYRNVFGLLREFGDAELAALITPRALIVEQSDSPPVKGPPPARAGRAGAAPGVIETPESAEVEAEVARANKLMAGRGEVQFVQGSEGTSVKPGSRKALALLARAMAVKVQMVADESTAPIGTTANADSTARQARTVKELEAFTQALFRRSESVRDERFRAAGGFPNPATREFFWSEVIGKINASKLPPNPRSRKIHDEPKWTGHDVMLDVLPDVFAWGVLLVPKDLKPGEQRPVVVCQHGLEGVPEDTITRDQNSAAFKAYKAFAAQLVEQGFIVYAPHNPYRGRDAFRVLQRKANPLGLSLFSFIIAQHETTTDWIASLPFADPRRIAFYGLSYGGKTAMRVPAVVERYCLSICSADFNEWVQKCVTTGSPYSYMFTGEYEMPEWNLGHTFNYAEMAALIAPRPFMVERGHDDGVAPDQWVAYEYAKVRRHYDRLGIGDRTEIEFFNGPHTINGVGTFDFLRKHLRWPAR
jgi:dienelactone hydrolase